jgi:hypothetical protein
MRRVCSLLCFNLWKDYSMPALAMLRNRLASTIASFLGLRDLAEEPDVTIRENLTFQKGCAMSQLKIKSCPAR